MCMIIFLRIIILSFQSHQTHILSGMGIRNRLSCIISPHPSSSPSSRLLVWLPCLCLLLSMLPGSICSRLHVWLLCSACCCPCYMVLSVLGYLSGCLVSACCCPCYLVLPGKLCARQIFQVKLRDYVISKVLFIHRFSFNNIIYIYFILFFFKSYVLLIFSDIWSCVNFYFYIRLYKYLSIYQSKCFS